MVGNPTPYLQLPELRPPGKDTGSGLSRFCPVPTWGPKDLPFLRVFPEKGCSCKCCLCPFGMQVFHVLPVLEPGNFLKDLRAIILKHKHLEGQGPSSPALWEGRSPPFQSQFAGGPLPSHVSAAST